MKYEIPLYSKNPIYMGNELTYDSAKGCYIKIGNKKYLDYGTMGIGCCMLGYNDKYVNHYVIKEINKGCFSSLNTKYMDKVSNLLLAMHPEFDLIRFGNTAGEMLYIALKLAIEKKLKEKRELRIVQAGYTGWIIKNLLNESNYEYGISHRDNINDIVNLDYEPDIIIGEIIRHDYPNTEAINKINKLQKNGAIFIIDEVTSGFHFNFGGVYKQYDLKPDIVVYAKAISNGYPFACLIGKSDIVKSDLFISSTYWTSNIGFVAAYRTLTKLKHCDYRLIVKLGQSIIKIWKTCAKKYDIKIKIGNVPNIANFDFDYKNSLELKSLFIQEMWKLNILNCLQFYPTFSHDAKTVGQYAKACNKVFEKIKDYMLGLYKADIKMIKELNK